MPLFPALKGQRQVDLRELEASLVYKVRSRTGSKATEKSCLENKMKQNKNKKYLGGNN